MALETVAMIIADVSPIRIRKAFGGAYIYLPFGIPGIALDMSMAIMMAQKEGTVK